MTDNKQNILIIGLGNLLLADEGLGIHAIKELERIYDIPDNVEVIDGGTIGVALFPYFRNRTYIIAIDAVNTGKEPGTIVKIKIPGKFSFKKTSSHQTSLQEVLNIAFLKGEEIADITLIGIQPESLETGLSLSQNVEANIGGLVDMIVSELDSFGVKIKLKSVCV